jgi:hypothetical protein
MTARIGMSGSMFRNNTIPQTERYFKSYLFLTRRLHVVGGLDLQTTPLNLVRLIGTGVFRVIRRKLPIDVFTFHQSVREHVIAASLDAIGT